MAMYGRRPPRQNTDADHGLGGRLYLDFELLNWVRPYNEFARDGFRPPPSG